MKNLMPHVNYSTASGKQNLCWLHTDNYFLYFICGLKKYSVEVRSFDLIFQHFSLQSGGALNYSFMHIKPINVLSVMQ